MGLYCSTDETVQEVKNITEEKKVDEVKPPPNAVESKQSYYTVDFLTTASTIKKEDHNEDIKKQQKKIALFGGTFDPPHKGHEAIVRKVLEMKELEIDEVWLIPAQLNPDKVRNPAKGKHRVAMLNSIFKDENRVQVSDWELKREGKSYTYNTLKYFTETFPHKFYFIMGSDQRFGEWDHANESAKMVGFILVNRAGHIANPSDVFRGVTEPSLRWNVVEFNDETNSTAVRAAIEKGEFTTGVTKDVLTYIFEHALYVKDDDTLTDLRKNLGL